MNEAEAIHYVKSEVSRLGVDGKLVYENQSNLGCADEFSGWINVGRDCQYDGDAIYVLGSAQVKKLVDIHEEIASSGYRLNSKNLLNRPAILEMTTGGQDALSNAYYQERGSKKNVLSVSLTSGRFINSKDGSGIRKDMQDAIDREIRDDEYTYEISLSTSIPAEIIEKR
mgnify:CR=1 FL=1